MKLLLTVVAFLAMTACAQGNDVAPTILPRIKAESPHLINVCISAFERKTGRRLPHSVNYISLYIYPNPDFRPLLHFGHGKPGTFARVSKGDHAFMSCEVSASKPRHVIFLGKPMERPLVGKFGPPEKGQPKTLYGSSEVLYKRVDNHFEYVASQVYSLNNLYKHNPELLNRKKTKPCPFSLPDNPAPPPTTTNMRKYPGCYAPVH